MVSGSGLQANAPFAIEMCAAGSSTVCDPSTATGLFVADDKGAFGPVSFNVKQKISTSPGATTTCDSSGNCAVAADQGPSNGAWEDVGFSGGGGTTPTSGFILTGAGPGGGPHVRVFDKDAKATMASFYAYNQSFTGGVHVAAGDVDGDGKPEIIT